MWGHKPTVFIHVRKDSCGMWTTWTQHGWQGLSILSFYMSKLKPSSKWRSQSREMKLKGAHSCLARALSLFLRWFPTIYYPTSFLLLNTVHKFPSLRTSFHLLSVKSCIHINYSLGKRLIKSHSGCLFSFVWFCFCFFWFCFVFAYFFSS